MQKWRKILILAIGLISVFLLIFLFFSLKKTHPFRFLRENQEFKTLTKKAEEAEKANNLLEAIGYLEKFTQGLAQHKRVFAVWFKLAGLYEKDNRLLNAREALQKIIVESGDGRLIQEAQTQLGNLNIKVLFSPLVAGNSVVYEVKEGDSLSKIAKQFNTTIDLLKQSNQIKTDHLRAGMKLKVSTARFSLIVDKSQNTLTLKANDEVVKVYTVSTGLNSVNNVTPVGTFKIINKIVNPVWYREGKVIPAGSLENILGTRWMGLSKSGYGIHGTTQPETIGKHITLGCVRMYNQDVEELFTILPIGTEVVIME